MKFFSVLLLLAGAAAGASAQSFSVYDGVTPAGTWAAGAPNALSGIEQYSPFSGSLSAAVPLYHVGGRGEAGFDLSWNLTQNWMALKRNAGTSYSTAIDPYPTNNIASGSSANASSNALGLGGPGAVYARTGATYALCGSSYLVSTTLTTLVFVTGTGAEVNLVDRTTSGSPYSIPNACSNQAANWNAGRGATFHTVDGSDIQFVADSAVLDQNPNVGASHGTAQLSGYLQFPNGATYRIDNSNVSWIRDRNGNKVTLSYTNGPSIPVDWYLSVLAPTQIVDSLNRTISINYADPACGGWCVTIGYLGWQAAARTIEIKTGPLAGLLRSGFSAQTIGQLFPNTGQPTSYNYNPTLAGSIQFPDGRQYTFQYDSYGELARIDLPAGGAVEYDYGSGDSASPSGFEGSPSDGNPVMIYRRLQERREYANGSALSSRTHHTVSSLDQSYTYDVETVYDPNQSAMATTKHSLFGSPLNALSLNGTGCNAWNEGLEFETDLGTDTNGNNPAMTMWKGFNTQSGCMNNPQVSWQISTIVATNQQSGVNYKAYDQYNNVLDKVEYDWGTSSPGQPLRETTTTYLYQSNANYAPPSNNLVHLPLYTTVYDGNRNEMAQTVWYYDSNPVGNAPGVVGHDAGYGTGFTVRGNLSTEWHWLNTSNAFLLGGAFSYDIAGNLLSASDGNQHTSAFGYADVNNSYAHAIVATNAAGQSGTAQYDYWSGNPASVTDANNRTSSYSYDGADRLVQTTLPNGGHSYLSYPNAATVVRQQDQRSSGDKALQSRTMTDGLGRPVESDTFTSATAYIATTTSYDAVGRVRTTANPSVSGDGLNYLTIYSYDALGRGTQVLTADGAAVNTSYSGNVTTVVDQAGREKQYAYDGLGRLTSVGEDPTGLGYGTGYYYDALNNLTLVSQGSCPNCKQRSFSYDSLSRLLSAQNPESGTTAYSYDAAGNLLTRVDARGIATSYGYDVLNRPLSIGYSDATPAVSYRYDAGAANCVGHLVSAANAYSTTNYTNFDALGNIVSSTQTTNGNVYSFSYGYDLASELTAETYPSGRTVTTSYNAVGQPSNVAGVLGSHANNYAGATYWPHGGLGGLFYGNGVVPVYSYNSRLQASQVYSTVGNNPNHFLQVLNYNWGTANNNGTLASATIGTGTVVPSASMSTVTQTYSYDGVNRLSSLTESSGSVRSFGYDSYGNMTVWNNGGFPLNGQTPGVFTQFDAANRLPAVAYDAAGNQLSLPNVCTNCLSYNAENRQTGYTPGNAADGTAYRYDANGNRVEKVDSAVTRVSVYDAFGQLAADYSNQLPALSPCGTCYLTWDGLGSVRMVTDQTGAVVARHDFLPFGEEIPAGYAGRNSQFGQNDAIEQKFTGQVRDQESGLDYFNARYFSGALGRFTSPDPGNAGADLYNPQSWNGYAYVGNNPLNAVDPSGYCSVFIAGITQSQDPKTAFTQIANQFGADQAYPYSGQGVLLSGSAVASEALSDWSNPATATALQALKGALSNNSGSVDVVAYSGGSATFTSAYNNLSAAEQNRIGNIVYISPGAVGGLAANASTSTVIGSGLLDIGATFLTTFAPGPLKHSGCTHQDFACLAQAASVPLSIVKANGPCTNQQTFSLRPTPSKGSASSTIHYGGSVNPGTGGPLNNPFSYVPLFGGVGGEDQPIPQPDTYFRSN